MNITLLLIQINYCLTDIGESTEHFRRSKFSLKWVDHKNQILVHSGTTPRYGGYHTQHPPTTLATEVLPAEINKPTSLEKYGNTNIVT